MRHLGFRVGVMWSGTRNREERESNETDERKRSVEEVERENNDEGKEQGIVIYCIVI